VIPSDPSGQNGLLVIGGSSLIGARLREVANCFPGPVHFTGRTRLGDGDLSLDADKPEDFAPDFQFEGVIVCTPIWLVSDELLERLFSLGMNRVVAFSSTSVLTKTQSGDSYEQAVVSKLAAGEQRIEEFCTQAGIAWTILRPTLIYDEGRDQNVTQIMRTIQRLGFFPIAGKADGRRRPVHARELAAAALQAVQVPNAANKAYNLSGGEVLTYRDMVARIFRAMGRTPVIVPVPLMAWRIGFAALSVIRKGGKESANVEMALRMSQHMDFSNDEAARDFGYAPGPFNPRFDGAHSP